MPKPVRGCSRIRRTTNYDLPPPPPLSQLLDSIHHGVCDPNPPTYTTPFDVREILLWTLYLCKWAVALFFFS
ncbi:hypothetical protein BYT27DRAFT_7188482, partial [Phlegmacium glaucopus]